MGRISKFLESELDMVNEYLGMARARLSVVTDLCEDDCSKITSELSNKDRKIVEYINNKLSNIDSKIIDSKEAIYKFKDFCLKQEKLIN